MRCMENYFRLSNNMPDDACAGLIRCLPAASAIAAGMITLPFASADAFATVDFQYFRYTHGPLIRCLDLYARV